METFPVTNGVTTFLSPPKGYVVDFEHPQQQSALGHYLVFGILGSLAFLCLIQRLYTKHYLTGPLMIDDALVCIAWLASVIMQSVQIWSILTGGLCHHAWEMPIEVFLKYMLSSYIAGPVFITCNGLSKLSLLAVYLQISPQRWFQITVWTTIVMVACYTVVIAGLLLFGCQPIRAAFDPYALRTGVCIDFLAQYISIAGANIVSDVLLFTIPIPMIVRLKMPLGQKIGVVLMFGVGSITVATSIIRMAYVPSLLGATDITWVAAPVNVWSFVEANLFIICGSMPTFRKFLKRFLPKRMGSSTHSHPSEPTSHESSQSNLHRQRRQGCAEFDAVELGDISERNKDAATEGEVTDVETNETRWEDSSEEATLDDGRSIVYKDVSGQI